MSTGWKFDASSFEIFTSGQLTADKTAMTDTVYVDNACNNLFGGNQILRLYGGQGHMEASWNAVADLTNGGEIYGIGHSLIGSPSDFKGAIHYQISDANNVLIVNKSYNVKDLQFIFDGGTAAAQTDHNLVMVDRVTYDPALPQYALLHVTVSVSGRVPSRTFTLGSTESPDC